MNFNFQKYLYFVWFQLYKYPSNIYIVTMCLYYTHNKVTDNQKLNKR